MNDEAFCALYDAHAGRLWAYVTRMTRDPAAADDIVQESFLRVYAASTLADTGEDHRRHYLYAVATNLVRRRARTSDVVDGASAHDASHDPEVEQHLAVQQALEALPLVERQTLWLSHVERWSAREIGAMLGYREGSVRQVAVRARRRFVDLFTRTIPERKVP